MRAQRHAVETRHDMDMEMEHDLAAGSLVELLDGDALAEKAALTARASFCVVSATAFSASAGASKTLRQAAFGITSTWPSARGMMSMIASVSVSS